MKDPVKILFMGLGVMGNPMAANLVSSGRYALSVYDIDSSRATNLLAQGAEPVTDLVAAIGNADLVMTSLPGPAQVEAVAFGEQGLIGNMQPGAGWIDLSTNNLKTCSKLVAATSEKSIDFLDAPVSGGDEGARSVIHWLSVECRPRRCPAVSGSTAQRINRSAEPCSTFTRSAN